MISKEGTKADFPKHAAKRNYWWTDQQQAAHIHLHSLHRLHFTFQLLFSCVQNMILWHWSFQGLKMLLGLTMGRKNWLLILLSVASSLKAVRWKLVVFYTDMTYQVVWIFSLARVGHLLLRSMTILFTSDMLISLLFAHSICASGVRGSTNLTDLLGFQQLNTFNENNY